MRFHLAELGPRRTKATIVLVAALSGCRTDGCSSEPRAGASTLTAGPASEPAAQMTIAATDVTGAPGVDPSAIRAAIRVAEVALLSCLDGDGSTGVVAMKMAIERDGFVGGIGLRDRTTYGSEEARSCLVRIVSAMKFPSPGVDRADAEVTLEVSTRFGAR